MLNLNLQNNQILADKQAKKSTPITIIGAKFLAEALGKQIGQSFTWGRLKYQFPMEQQIYTYVHSFRPELGTQQELFGSGERVLKATYTGKYANLIFE